MSSSKVRIPSIVVVWTTLVALAVVSAHGAQPPWVLVLALVAIAATTVMYEIALRGRDRTNKGLESTLSLTTTTLDAAVPAIVVADAAGRVDYCNAEFSRIFAGRCDGEVVGRQFETLPCLFDAVEEADGLRAHIADSTARPDADSHYIFSAADSRIFELRSRPRRVGRSVVGRVWGFRDITDAIRLMDDLSHQALHDGVTGLANQVLLRNRLEHAVARARRTAAPIAVLMIKLDDFDVINRALGREAGDRLLLDVAERFRTELRESDTIARVQADVFAVVLDHTTEVGGQALASRIGEVLDDPFVLDGREVHVRASIGVADNTADALDAEELLFHAEIAMHAAKARGRSNDVFEESMQADLIRRQEIYGDLRRALRTNQLEVWYQPLLKLAENEVEGLEALLRWRHPTQGLVGPDEIIPVAEETGLIVDIGRWVLRASCRQVVEWSDVLGDQVSVSVNMSARQLYHDRLVDDVAEALSESGLAGRRLILEVTESSLLANLALVEERLAALRALDVRVAIDDFGTGHSSLTYLQSVDLLKIDRRFVRGFGPDDTSQDGKLVRSMVSMARNFGIGLVAEGIEHEDELSVIRGSGCEAGQGYLFAAPLPADQIPLAVARLHRAQEALVDAARAEPIAPDEQR